MDCFHDIHNMVQSELLEDCGKALKQTLDAKFNPSDMLQCSNKHPICKRMWMQRRSLYDTNKAEKMALCRKNIATDEEYVKWRDERHAMKLRHVNLWLRLYTDQRQIADSFLKNRHEDTHAFSTQECCWDD